MTREDVLNQTIKEAEVAIRQMFANNEFAHTFEIGIAEDGTAVSMMLIAAPTIVVDHLFRGLDDSIAQLQKANPTHGQIPN